MIERNSPGRQTVHLHVQVQSGCLIAAALAAAIGCSAGSPSAGATAAASSAAAAVTSGTPAAEPETEAGVRAAAAEFYAFYAAGLWPQAWAMLAPASQAAVPESLYAAVHQGCPSPSASMARVIKSVVMAGSTAVVTETVAGAAGSLAGTQADAWEYAGGRWGYVLTASTLAAYSHGSAAADVAALQAAGQCAGAQPTFATVAPATMPAVPPPSPFPTAS